MSETILSIRGLTKNYELSSAFFRSKEVVHAVENVNLEIREGETLGIVGESGCGKSTLGRMIVRLEQPTDGTILFEGEDLAKVSKKKLRALRGFAWIRAGIGCIAVDDHLNMRILRVFAANLMS